ncbi:MAG TPA: hypothetical protein VGL33_17370 [Streptosporangiaceae bacterium]
MARIGSLAAWEQRLAAQRRDEDRLAREHRQREKDTERLRQQEHLAERQRAAEEQTAEVEERMKALGEVLTGVLPLRPLTFERLLAASREHRFDPGPLGSALPAPDWDDFAPVPAVGFGRLGLGRAGRHPDPETPGGAHPQLRGQPQERAEVPALPHRVGEREPHRARPGGRGEPQGERLQQRSCPVGEPALADQQVAVPGEPVHRRYRRHALAQPQDPDPQPVRRRRLRVGPVIRPG